MVAAEEGERDADQHRGQEDDEDGLHEPLILASSQIENRIPAADNWGVGPAAGIGFPWAPLLEGPRSSLER